MWTTDGGMPKTSLVTLVKHEGALLRVEAGITPLVILDVGPESDMHVYVVLVPPVVDHGIHQA